MTASVPATHADHLGIATTPHRGVASRLVAGFLFVATGLVARRQPSSA